MGKDMKWSMCALAIHHPFFIWCQDKIVPSQQFLLCRDLFHRLSFFLPSMSICMYNFKCYVKISCSMLSH